MTQGQAAKQDLGLALDMMDRRIASAKEAKCSDQGHHEVDESLGDFADCFRHLSAVVDELPNAIADRLSTIVPAGVPATPGWHEIARRFAATLASSPWAIVGIVGLFAVSPSLRELARALVEAMR